MLFYWNFKAVIEDAIAKSKVYIPLGTLEDKIIQYMYLMSFSVVGAVDGWSELLGVEIQV
jgi:hypothetical protein